MTKVIVAGGAAVANTINLKRRFLFLTSVKDFYHLIHVQVLKSLLG